VGYENFLDALKYPDDTEQEHIPAWMDDEFDSAEFDLAAVNRMLANVR
jgi:hypothetical protein